MTISDGKYNSWRISIEGDYFSLYVKTWFAFLSTLHELYPDKISSIGDGSLINHYLSVLEVPVSYDQSISSAVKKVYSAAENVISEQFSKYYFSSFFDVDKSYSYYFKEIDGHISIRVIVTKQDHETPATGRKKRTSDVLYIEIKSSQKQFLEHIKPQTGDNSGYTLNCRVGLGEIIKSDNYNDASSMVNLVREKLFERLELLFEERGHTKKQREKAEAFLPSVIHAALQTWSVDFKSEQLFPKSPCHNYPTEDTNKKNSMRWFVSFSYKLRNVLFHHIIDPFDKEWQDIYKNTYVALKEIVDDNIEKIEASKLETTDES